MKTIVVFASGNGSNFAAMANAFQPSHNIRIALLVCDQPGAPVLQLADKYHVPTLVVDYRNFKNKAAAEAHIVAHIPPCNLVVLAGFMRIIGPTLLNAYPNRIINLHPALLPSFPGRTGIADAYNYGVKVTGVTVHYVDAGIDSGQIIAQAPVPVLPDMTLNDLETTIHETEHVLLPQTVAMLLATLDA
ncbi:phosphoribosylglycinamide formyltransferase [Lacticaseibacillus pabuli]|uniref:Phosphoribosylglycinamide formyltransferase n=1 Tax=Lacticaseibacillus pabuli TaxID=3025672 RepID=A0ABY7WQ67_9LACO|nr:phosphoribosylglycinamide formyltransferase [Lacticaseibacillus sp. KACC 23028]WDF82335.1 phosphoribosylglycinamide formyltransferase [Lacticaseibacillus sp. KACC 23028]